MKEDYFELKQKIPIISQKFSEEVKLNFLNIFFQRGIRNKKSRIYRCGLPEVFFEYREKPQGEGRTLYNISFKIQIQSSLTGHKGGQKPVKNVEKKIFRTIRKFSSKSIGNFSK